LTGGQWEILGLNLRTGAKNQCALDETSQLSDIFREIGG